MESMAKGYSASPCGVAKIYEDTVKIVNAAEERHRRGKTNLALRFAYERGD